MVKKALLIGINYTGTKSALRGCINDCDNLAEMITKVYGFKEEDITKLTDDTALKPTKANILSELDKIVASTNLKEGESEEIWISYSGHGSYAREQGPGYKRDEADGREEALVPLDYATHGLILDDELHEKLLHISEKTKAVILIDACHSGSIFDMKYRYQAGLKEVIENPKDTAKANVVMISGCMDSQTSADAWNIDNSREFEGAMTRSFLHVMKQYEYDVTCYRLLKKMREFLKGKRFPQVPQMSCTRKLTRTTAFSISGDVFRSYMVTE
jgi:hypothetical protein